MSLSANGIVAKGTMSRIAIKDWFELTGIGLDKKYGTADDGVTFSMELTPKAQEFLLSGKLKVGSDKWGLFKTESQTECIFNIKQMKFLTDTSLFGGRVHLKLEAKSVGPDLLTIQDFVVHGVFKGDFEKLLKEEVSEYIDEFEQDVQEQYKKGVRILKRKENKIKKMRKKIAEMYAQLTGEGAEAVRKITRWQREVDKINDEIDRTQKKMDKIPGRKIGKRAFLAGKIATLWVGHKAAIASLQVAKLAIGATTGSLDFDIVRLETKEFRTREDVRMRWLILENIRKTLEDLGILGKKVAKNLRRVFLLRKASLDFSMKELIKEKKLPLITINGVILGKQFRNEKIQADFSQPKKIVKDIFNKAKMGILGKLGELGKAEKAVERISEK